MNSRTCFWVAVSGGRISGPWSGNGSQKSPPDGASRFRPKRRPGLGSAIRGSDEERGRDQEEDEDRDRELAMTLVRDVHVGILFWRKRRANLAPASRRRESELVLNLGAKFRSQFSAKFSSRVGSKLHGAEPITGP